MRRSHSEGRSPAAGRAVGASLGFWWQPSPAALSITISMIRASCTAAWPFAGHVTKLPANPSSERGKTWG